MEMTGVYSGNDVENPIERSVTPTLNYKRQGKFDQLDIGLYWILDPVMFGAWYRGVPIKHYEANQNNESIVLMAGLHHKNFSFGYSFDFTTSTLGLRNGGGAHELSLIYEWDFPYPNKKKTGRVLPCPKFYHRTKIL